MEPDNRILMKIRPYAGRHVNSKCLQVAWVYIVGNIALLLPSSQFDMLVRTHINCL